jgi:NADH dehydrogenase [ubiquinone] 1 alpha subcomplex assembly factor 6
MPMHDRSTGKTASSVWRSSVAASLSPVALIVRTHDRDRFQTALFAPTEARETLFALYAFNYEIARVRESVREPMLGRIRLQWWREAIDTAYDGGSPRRHEVVEPLTAAIRTHAFGREHFERLIEAREGDLDEAPPATLAALEDYAERTSAPLIRLALEALGAATPQTLAAATEIGIAYALTGIIRALPLHARAGRTIIPDDIAEGTGLDRGDCVALRATPALRRAVEAIAGASTRRLDAARAMRRGLPRAALPALLPARIAAHVLRRLERAGFDPFSGAGESDPLQSWRLAFASMTGRF